MVNLLIPPAILSHLTAKSCSHGEHEVVKWDFQGQCVSNKGYLIWKSVQTLVF